MHEAAERLAKSMLFEGYALYPYTPQATKNSTPTPFGIAYPPAYAAHQPAAFDHVQVEVVATASDDAEIEAAALFLQAAGPRHQAAERREQLAPARIGSLLEEPLESSFVHEARAEEGVVTGEETRADRDVLSGIVRLSAERVGGDAVRIRLRVENATPLPESEASAMERGEALRRSLLSCHAMLGRARRPVRLAARERGRGRGGRAGMRERQHLAGARLARRRRGPRRGLHAPRPPAGRRAEQGEPVRQHRDRGGAAAPRPRAQRRGARGDRRRRSGGARDGRAGRVDDAGRDPQPARGDAADRSRARRRRPGPGGPASTGARRGDRVPGVDRARRPPTCSGRTSPPVPGRRRLRARRTPPESRTSSSTAERSPAAARSSCGRAPTATPTTG